MKPSLECIPCFADQAVRAARRFIEDARFAGLDELADIIDTGQLPPGVLLDKTSPRFRSAFREADLVFSKGQGNFETLDVAPGKIWFLFIAKCKTVASFIGCEIGTPVVTDRV